MKVEFTSQPPAFEIAPVVNGKAIIRFYENIETVEKEEIVAYVADCYETNPVINSENLMRRIMKNPDTWLEKAKKDQAEREDSVTPEERIMSLEAKNKALEAESVSTMLAITEVYELLLGG